MKIENEIRQENFRNEYHKLAVNLSYTYFWVLDHLRQQLRPYDISLQQYNILRILRGQYPKPSTINLLKERMLDKSSDASRLVERLRLKGLLKRVPSVHDRRSVDIIITQKGLDILNTIGQTEHEFESALQNIDETDAQRLNTLLDKIRG
jgi:DNA-binding MarR family transcriptional regulator